MTGVSIDVGNLEGVDELRQTISQIQRFDRARLMQRLADTTEGQVRRRITSEKRGPDGPWAKWSRRYAVSRQGGAGSLLNRSGGLLDSITAFSSEDEAGVGTNKAYARTHQLGDSRTITIGAHIRNITQAFGRRLKERRAVTVRSHQLRRNIPARPFLWWSTSNIEELREVALDFLEQTTPLKR